VATSSIGGGKSNAGGEEHGLERLQGHARNPKLSIEEVLDGVCAFSAGQPPADDTAVVVVLKFLRLRRGDRLSGTKRVGERPTPRRPRKCAPSALRLSDLGRFARSWMSSADLHLFENTFIR